MIYLNFSNSYQQNSYFIKSKQIKIWTNSSLKLFWYLFYLLTRPLKFMRSIPLPLPISLSSFQFFFRFFQHLEKPLIRLPSRLPFLGCHFARFWVWNGLNRWLLFYPCCWIFAIDMLQVAVSRSMNFHELGVLDWASRRVDLHGSCFLLTRIAISVHCERTYTSCAGWMRIDVWIAGRSLVDRWTGNRGSGNWGPTSICSGRSVSGLVVLSH